jgi:hypothetical protein
LASNTSHSLSNMIPTSPANGSSLLPAAIPFPHLVNTSLLCPFTILVRFRLPSPSRHPAYLVRSILSVLVPLQFSLFSL